MLCTQVAPWASITHLVDSHEDSFGLAVVADAPLASFLKTVGSRDDTLTVVLSDHGLHYGEYFLTPHGRRERNNPLLHVRAPPRGRAAIDSNAAARVGPFDMHATFLDVLLGASAARGASLASATISRERSLAELGIEDPKYDAEAPSVTRHGSQLLDARRDLTRVEEAIGSHKVPRANVASYRRRPAASISSQTPRPRPPGPLARRRLRGGRGSNSTL